MSNNNDPSKNLIQTISPTKDSDIRAISIIRDESGYGFTLSRSVIYANDPKFQNFEPIGTNQTEIVYVKHVRKKGPAFTAGLREGDRPISIDNVSILDKKYSEIIEIMENSGIILELIVIPSFIQTPGSSTTKKAMLNNSNSIQLPTESVKIEEIIISTTNSKTNLPLPTTITTATTTISIGDVVPTTTTSDIASISNTSPPPFDTTTTAATSISTNNSTTTPTQIVEFNLVNNSENVTTTTTTKTTTATTSGIETSTYSTPSPTPRPTPPTTPINNNNETRLVTSPLPKFTETSSSSPLLLKRSPSTPHHQRSLTPNHSSLPLIQQQQQQQQDQRPLTPTKSSSPALITLPQSRPGSSLHTRQTTPAIQNPDITINNNNSQINSNSSNLSSSIIKNEDLATIKNQTEYSLNILNLNESNNDSNTKPIILSATTNTVSKPQNLITNTKYNNLITNHHASTIGTGISALLYSLLKNSNKTISESTNNEHNNNNNNNNNNYKRVNRLKESGYIQNFEPMLNQSAPSSGMVVASPLLIATSSSSSSVPPLAINESSSLSSTSSSPRTKIKLKNLQEALIKEYSNEHVNQFRINDRKPEQLYASNNIYTSTSNRNDTSGYVKKEQEPILYPEYKFSYQQYYLDNKNELTNNNQFYQNAANKHPFYYDTNHPIHTNNSNNKRISSFEPMYSNSSINEEETYRNRYLNMMMYNTYPAPFINPMSMASLNKTRQQELAALIKRTSNLSQQYQQNTQQQQQPEFYHDQDTPLLLNRNSFNNSSIKSQTSTSTVTSPQTDVMPTDDNQYTHPEQKQQQQQQMSKTKSALDKSPNKASSPNKESVLLNAVAAAAAAVNKASPQLFSKYIETVHRAMHGRSNTTANTTPAANTNTTSSDKQQQQQQQNKFTKPTSLPPTSLRDNYTTPYEVYTNADHEFVRSKRFVDQCRQLFEQQQQQKKLQQSLAEKQFYSLPKTKSKVINPVLNTNYPLYSGINQTANKQASSSLSPTRDNTILIGTSKKLTDLTGSANQMKSGDLRANSLGDSSVHKYNTKNQENQQQQPQQQRSTSSSSHFNHFNRASYKGECKRMMAKSYMETVAERAARFEDIDIERYNRMKNKILELEMQQQRDLELQYRLNQAQQEYHQLHKTPPTPTSTATKQDELSKAENFVMKLKNLRPIIKTTSPDSSVIQNNNNNKQQSKDQEQSMWTKFEPFIAKYYTVNTSPTTNNNVKLAANFISTNNNNNNLLTNFVGDISGGNKSSQQQQQTDQMSQYYQQQQQMNKLNNSYTSSSFARRELLLNELKQHQQQILMQQQLKQKSYQYDFDYDDDYNNQYQQQDNIDQEQYYKRRSITSSPVRFNFNSKSSPPVIMRIDSAKIAKLNRLRSFEQQQQQILNDSNNYHFTYNEQQQQQQQQQVNTTPLSSIQSWPNNYRNISSSSNTNNNNNNKSNSYTRSHYNNNNNNNSAFMMTSDVGETTSTDSDIGTSPSGTTLASPPSSPQQPQLKQTKLIKLQPPPLPPPPTPPTQLNSVIRHHSYLNAVQLNDFKLNHQIKSNNFATINENENGLSIITNNNTNNNQIISDEIKYYYSPSATVIRQQKLLQQKQQEQHNQLKQIQNRIKSLNEEKLLASLSSSLMARSRSKSNNQMQQSLSLEQNDDFEQNKYNNNTMNFNNQRIKNLISSQQQPQQQQQQNRHTFQQRSQTITTTTDENEDNRNNSYLKATNKQEHITDTTSTSTTTATKSKQTSSTTPVQSRNTSIKKLKNFFGEKTPVVLQAVENKNIIASDDFLTTLLETVKEGVLNCKIVSKDGKRSTDRSWRPAWAVLKKSGALFLCKEKKDNIMIPSVDSYPINLKNSTIDVAYDYNKPDNESMMEWIRAMQENSSPPDLTSHYPHSKSNSEEIESHFKYNQQQKQQQQQQLRTNWMSMTAIETNNSSNSLNDQMNMSNSNLNKTNTKLKTNDLMIASSPEEYFLNNSQISNFNANLNVSNNQVNNSNMSPTQVRKSEDTSPRRDNSNRRWVRQMTRRIRDFMTNTNTNDENLHSHEHENSNLDLDSNRNFGIPLDKCEPSSTSPYVPVVIELCTRLIELHIIDEGIYRKVGQKQVVNALRAQLNRGVLNIDVSDFNWDNPHAVVSLLKCFLNELPDSLTTSQFYNEFIQMCRIEHHHIRLIAIKKLLRKLSIYNYETLRYLSAHLRRVAAAYQHNKMTIKNLCIAFSQSLIRLNEANCETIKSDHVSQSLLIELILIYHDWLFDSAQMDNVPDQIKDLVEAQLFQQYCSYIEPMCYTDLLLNIMKSIRSRWYSTNSSINSSISNTVTAAYSNKNMNLSNSSSNEHDFNNSRQSSNIQFRSIKKEIFRTAKSASVLNNTQGKVNNKQQQIVTKQTNKKQNEDKKHSRSRSVDIRFKSIGLLLTSSSSSNGTGGLLSKQSSKMNSKKIEETNNNNTLKHKQKINQDFISTSSSSCSSTTSGSLNNSIKFKKFQPLSRKSYGDLIKTTLFEDFIDPTSDPLATTKIENSNSNLTNEPVINFKLLEKKSEQEREKLTSLMKKLEIDLINAKMDLMEEDYMKTTPISLIYPNISSNNNVKSKPLSYHNLNTNNPSLSTSSTSSSSSSSATNNPILPVVENQNEIIKANKHILKSYYSASSSSGIVATTGPSSSSSSSVSTSPPPISLDIQKQQHQQQQQIKPPEINSNETTNQQSESPINLKQSKNVRLLLINRPRKLPKRRHTIGSKFDSIEFSKTSEINYSSLSSTSSSSNFSSNGEDTVYTHNKKQQRQQQKKTMTKIIDDINRNDHDADDDDDMKVEQKNPNERKKKLFKQANNNVKEHLDLNDRSSRSIHFLPSLEFYKDSSLSILFPGPLENKNITRRRTISKKSSVNTLNKSNKKVILNLSSLSMSASSISSSSSSSSSTSSLTNAKEKELPILKILDHTVSTNSLNIINNKLSVSNRDIINKKEDIKNLRLSKNYDELSNDSIKLDNYIKQNNVKFNCTFESLI